MGLSGLSIPLIGGVAGWKGVRMGGGSSPGHIFSNVNWALRTGHLKVPDAPQCSTNPKTVT